MADPHSFSADRPITKANEDRLGRAGFARQLAEAIAAWRGKDSLVIALYGSWGIGKSSIKNMVLESLQGHSKGPRVVEYNPWQWSGHDQLAQGFFSEVGRTLGRHDDSREARTVAHAWRLYAARLGVPLYVADESRRLAAWLVAGGGLLTLLSPTVAEYLPKVAASTFYVVGGVLLLTVAGGLGFAHKLVSHFAEVAAARASLRAETTLEEQKAELRVLLSKVEQPVLVVIDDIDRLRPDQIRLLFQLVKANADFPNLTYLLLFQRDVVESAVRENASEGERNFLEKIVQIGFDVPPVEEERLQRALFEGLDQIVGDEAVAKRFEAEHWQAVFPEMRPFFRNLRDVARFLSSFSFHVSLFRQGKSFEVNPVDLIAVETIRIFEPEVFARMKVSKDVLTGKHQFLSRRDNKAEVAAVEQIIDAARDGRRDAVRDLVKAMFPVVQGLLGGSTYGDGFSEEWLRSSRVCHEKVFDRYFLLALPQGDISQGDFDYLIENAGDRAIVAGRLREFVRAGQIEAVLNRLDAYKQQLPLEHIEPFVTALMDIGDSLPESKLDLFSGSFGAEIHAGRFIHWSLKTVSDTKERSALLRRACLATTGLYLPVKEVAQQESKEKLTEYPDSYFMSDEDIQACKPILLQRIRERSSAELLSNPFLSYLLYRWRAWADPQEVQRWASDLIRTGASAVEFLTRVAGRYRTSGSPDVGYRFSIKGLSDFIDPEAIEASVQQLDSTTLTQEQQRVVKAFQKARLRAAEGKSDDYSPFDDDD